MGEEPDIKGVGGASPLATALYPFFQYFLRIKSSMAHRHICTHQRPLALRHEGQEDCQVGVLEVQEPAVEETIETLVVIAAERRRL